MALNSLSMLARKKGVFLLPVFPRIGSRVPSSEQPSPVSTANDGRTRGLRVDEFGDKLLEPVQLLNGRLSTTPSPSRSSIANCSFACVRHRLL